MLPIKKNHPPNGLLNYKKHSENPTYKEFSEVENFKGAFFELRECLVKEQKYLCCYCLQRIEIVKDNVPNMKTEHFLPKDEAKYPQDQLDYQNLLAACLGNQKSPGREKHCDSMKGNEELQFLRNPASKSFQQVLDYQVLTNQKEVRIVPAAPHKDNKFLLADIETRLNLNEQSLRSRRFSAWTRTCKSIGFEIGKSWDADQKSIRLLGEKLEEHRSDFNKSKYQEFSDFIFSWFSKRFINEISISKMKTLILIILLPTILRADPHSPNDSLKKDLEKLETTQEKQTTQLELLEKKIDLAKEANENRLNAMQVSIDKQLFFLDPLLLAGVGLSAIGGLIYLFVSFVPTRVRAETAKKIAALTETDRITVAEVIAQREIAKKMKQSAHISILCTDDAQRVNAETLLKDMLGFRNITFNLAADFDLMIFYDPKVDKSKWGTFREHLKNVQSDQYFLYYGSARDFDNHENLNFANSKFTLESMIIKTLQFHSKFRNA
jgi:uncharacterized protein (TIGR02646 family)